MPKLFNHLHTTNNPMQKLSESEEEYLEALYRLNGNDDRVRVKKLAEGLEVRESSVVEMLKKLDKKKLVKYRKYKGAKLTDGGKEAGMKITRKHMLAERLLSDVLNRDLPDIHEEACKLEHSLADETADEIEKVLKNPKTCPHGNPIPEKNPESEEDSLKLSEAEEGETYEVITIPEEKEDIQRLLPLCVLPGAKIELTDKPSFSAIMVSRGDDTLALSREIASKIKVRPYEQRKRHRHHGRASG